MSELVTETKGVKLDSGKLQFGLLTRSLARPIEAVVAVLTYASLYKYAPDNWKKVEDPVSSYSDALDRHLSAWRKGEALDPQTGLHHLAHAACNLLFLLWFEMQSEPERDFAAWKTPKCEGDELCKND